MKKEQQVYLVFAMESLGEYLVRLAGAVLGTGTTKMIDEKAKRIRRKSLRGELR